MTLRTEIVTRLTDVPAAAWDALVGHDNPFIEHAFLSGLEESGSVGARETGWQPRHVLIWRGTTLVGAAPLYLKHDSYGEYIFDWGWAQAAHRALCDEERKLLQPAQQDEQRIKSALSAYATEQDRLRREEQRRLEQEQRRADEERSIAEAAALEREARATGDAAFQDAANALIEAPAVMTAIEPTTRAAPSSSSATGASCGWTAAASSITSPTRAATA